jgi:transposase
MENGLKKINPQAAGIDIGADKIFVCAEDGGYKTFGCFTQEFKEAAKYMKAKAVSSVAMEATGVYWVALKDILEEEGLQVVLVRAGDAKQLPGRDKTDGVDCQWIRTLHQHGLLRPCMIPEATIRELRTFMRMRQDNIEMAAQHIQHIQKAFTLMNLRLPQVISQITGASGKRIIEAILAGERDAQKLVLLCDKQILKNKKEEVILSLQGNYKDEYLFMLGQGYKGWQFYNSLNTECDAKINAWLQRGTENKKPLQHITKEKMIRHHKPQIENFHEKMLLFNDGKDVSQLPGITDYTAIQIMAEVGTDMSKWKNVKHFVSWLGLAPKKHYSGKMKRHKRGTTNTKAGQLFKESAQVLLKSTKISLGSFARRIRALKGPAIAIKASARKLAIMYYNVMTKGMEYVEQGIEKYEKQVKQTELDKLNRWANRMGFKLLPNQINVVHQ